jgi:hypothetical protein
MPNVELIYDADCPNAEAARSQLRLALAQAGQAPQWGEWERSDRAAPPYVRRYGSPTILVDGRDVAGGAPTEADCCRIYQGENGRLQGVPSAETIAAALRQTAAADVPAPRASGGLLAWLALIPAFAAAIVPNLACPACWPAYAGLLSSLGLGFLVPFLMQTKYLLPLTMLALLVAITALGFRARRRRGYGPFLVGLLGAGLVVAGKFVLAESDPVVIGGLALLVGASVWNSWPKRTRSPTCPSCVATGCFPPS